MQYFLNVYNMFSSFLQCFLFALFPYICTICIQLELFSIVLLLFALFSYCCHCYLTCSSGVCWWKLLQVCVQSKGRVQPRCLLPVSGDDGWSVIAKSPHPLLPHHQSSHHDLWGQAVTGAGWQRNKDWYDLHHPGSALITSAGSAASDESAHYNWIIRSYSD